MCMFIWSVQSSSLVEAGVNTEFVGIDSETECSGRAWCSVAGERD